MTDNNSAAQEQAAPTTRRRSPPRAEHVGSLLRPKALLEQLDEAATADANVAMAEGRAVSDQLRSLEDELIREAVAKQTDAGLDVVTDGEFRRAFFTGGIDVAVRGFQPSEQMIVFENASGQTFETPGRPTVAARLEKVGNPLVAEAEFLAQITDRPFKVTMPAASMYQWYGVWTPVSPTRRTAIPTNSPSTSSSSNASSSTRSSPLGAATSNSTSPSTPST